MMTFRVKVNEFENGELVRVGSISCDVQGKELDEETIKRRLKNNIKTWQTAFNRDRLTSKRTFEVESYERIK